MKNELLPSDYKDTLELIIQKIELAQQKAVISANGRKTKIVYNFALNLEISSRRFFMEIFYL